MPLANPLVRLVPPSLVWLLYTLKYYEFVPTNWLFPGDDVATQAAAAWQFAGLLLPALYLASVGPDGLVEKGLGFFTVQVGSPQELAGNRKMLARMGIIWLGIFAACASLLLDGVNIWPALTGSRFLLLFTYFLMHVGLISGIGVFLFLASKPVRQIGAENSTEPKTVSY